MLVRISSLGFYKMLMEVRVYKVSALDNEAMIRCQGGFSKQLSFNDVLIATMQYHPVSRDARNAFVLIC